ncbi:hypothetical protein COCNU_scaffold001289G000010 [Cocos nucifera]|nr:hypothetical protein [Cocos nucifera]
MKDAASFSIRKGSFEKEIVELKRNVGNKSWVLTVKISYLKADLKAMREKIQLLEESSSWSSNKARFEWDWSMRFSAL